MENDEEQHNHPLFPPKEPSLSETTENYLKRILWLMEDKNYAKVSEIAELMDRSLSSTTEAMKRLEEQGLVEYHKQGKITLTQKGEIIATSVNQAYKTLANLLLLLGVPKDLAHLDACSMEHSITPKTITIVNSFIDFINSDPVNSALLQKFRDQS